MYTIGVRNSRQCVSLELNAHNADRFNRFYCDDITSQLAASGKSLTPRVTRTGLMQGYNRLITLVFALDTQLIQCHLSRSRTKRGVVVVVLIVVFVPTKTGQFPAIEVVHLELNAVPFFALLIFNDKLASVACHSFRRVICIDSTPDPEPFTRGVVVHLERPGAWVVVVCWCSPVAPIHSVCQLRT